MAQRRMLDRDVLLADDFLECTATARNFYVTCNMMADDDGFVGNPMSLIRMLGCCREDLDQLVAKGYLIAFPSGVVVITHWLIHNSIRKDRYHKTVYTAEWEQLDVEEGGRYVVRHPSEKEQSKTEEKPQKMAWQQAFSTLGTDKNFLVATGEGREGQVREDQFRRGEDRQPSAEPAPKKGVVVTGEYQNVRFTPREWKNLQSEFPTDYGKRVRRLSEYMKISGKQYKNHLAVIRKWAREDRPPEGEATFSVEDLERLFEP